MKRRTTTTISLGIAAVLGAGFASANFAQPEIDEAQMMELWMAAAAPGDAHDGLKRLVGEWTCTSRMYMAPDAPPMESTAKASCRLVMGGRFVEQRMQGEMMGMPFEGFGLTGYNNMRKQYTGMWVDNMGTAILTMNGSADQSGNVITMLGQMDEPTTGEIGKTVKWVTRFLDKDTYVFEAFEVQYGDPFKVFDITYTRAR
ncbi:MAG: DUF1579 domain-containing protein [Phycisphaerales bacterium]|nr:DUF1579 domain-containing protein [Phycisphaerales bacterium]